MGSFTIQELSAAGRGVAVLYNGLSAAGKFHTTEAYTGAEAAGRLRPAETSPKILRGEYAIVLAALIFTWQSHQFPVRFIWDAPMKRSYCLTQKMKRS